MDLANPKRLLPVHREWSAPICIFSLALKDALIALITAIVYRLSLWKHDRRANVYNYIGDRVRLLCPVADSVSARWDDDGIKMRDDEGMFLSFLK
jgi:hypothetical protein